MTNIHPTALVNPDACVDASVIIGPYCVVGAEVKLAANVVLHSHVVVEGDTHIDEGTQIFPFASIGHAPQDKKFRGEHSRLRIGARNLIREHVTMNPGTEGGGMETRVGNDCLFMASSHVAHDCQVGDQVILANNATLAGHVHVGNGAIIGGLSAIHQFVRIGHYAFIGGMSGVEKDVIPYGTVKGERASLDGLNLVGLKRRQVDRSSIHALRHAFKEIFLSDVGTLSERANQLKNTHDDPEVLALIDFILRDSSRAFCTPNKFTTSNAEAA
jgi:UDP-N-acetylglucosamine acyltransferase